jgi:hypothetical protein
MQLEPECSRKLLEVAIRREYRKFAPYRDGTDEKVRVRSLDAALPTPIVCSSSILVVVEIEFEIGKGTQVLTQLLELWLRLDPRQELLSHGSDEKHTSLVDERSQLPRHGVIDTPSSTKRERPHGSVDEDIHGRRRCFL